MKKIIKIAISLSSIIVCVLAFSISVCANYSNYDHTYTTTQDAVYSFHADPNTNGKILVFGRPACGRTNYTLNSIAESDWIDTANIDVACINRKCYAKCYAKIETPAKPSEKGGFLCNVNFM